MEWLRNNKLLGANRPGNHIRPLLSTDEECDPQACYDSFKQHWHQALKIIKRNQQLPTQDDVLSVVNHMEQMGALLLYDIKKVDQLHLISSKSNCLDYLISENVLDKLYEWGIRTGKYVNAVKSEQLKLYEMLICQSRHVLLVHKSFLEPLLKILSSCLNEVFPKQMEKLLINLLYQLCIVLMQNVDLVGLFFLKNEQKQKFVILALLIPFVHRDDNIGMQARDSVLLCMSLSRKNSDIREYIANVSNICALLASGLGGLYSDLPHKLDDIVVPDWHRLTPDDVNDIRDLSTFVTSLEFSNSVAQMAHGKIVLQMQEFMHMGFLVPIFGPALLQVSTDEQIAVTAYLELMLRTVTNPGLLRPLIKFLLTAKYDGPRLLDMLMQRINSPNTQLSLVSIALFETLVDLNCEDVMLELVFQHLQPCLHIILSQRKMLFPIDPHCESAEKFLQLAPDCSETNILSPNIDGRTINWNHYGGHPSLYGNYHAYLCDAKNKINTCQAACDGWTNSYTACESHMDNTDEQLTSLPSLGESSGYESLKLKVDEPARVWQISQHQQEPKSINYNNHSDPLSSGSVGPFLTILMEKLEDMLSNSFFINLHLTGLISRLAIYSHPISRAYLLDHSLILQPNVPSLFQILGSLKQKIDEFLTRQPEKHSLIQYAKQFLLERETRLVHARRLAHECNSLNSTSSSVSTATTMSQQTEDQPFQRNGPKRRSLTQSLSSISSMFGRRQSQVPPVETNIQMVAQTEDIRQALSPNFNDAQRVAVCAVLLDEWVKELAALGQEHAISQLAVLLK